MKNIYKQQVKNKFKNDLKQQKILILENLDECFSFLSEEEDNKNIKLQIFGTGSLYLVF
jgi:predicted phage-related endonuclease